MRMDLAAIAALPVIAFGSACEVSSLSVGSSTGQDAAGGDGGTVAAAEAAPAAEGADATPPVDGSAVNTYRAEFVYTDLKCAPAPAAIFHGSDVASCVLVEAAPADCGCAAAGHAPVSAEVARSVRRKGVYVNDCLCELLPATGTTRDQCLNDPSLSASAVGWCFVDPQHGAGSAALTAGCPPTAQTRLRAFDPSNATSAYLLACPAAQSVQTRPLGAACLPSDEDQPTFSGYSVSEVNYDDGSVMCESGMCLVNHFQGRVSCPYGQPADRDAGSDRCYLPGSDVEVTVAVAPQLTGRRAEVASTCTCRCAGIGPGPFCTCPTGLSCVELLRPIGPGGNTMIDYANLMYSGSYCIPDGAGTVPVDASTLGEPCTAGTCGVPRPY